MPPDRGEPIERRVLPRGERPRVLIVDDHPDTCDLYAAAFRAVGIEIVAAFDGGSGLGMVDSGRWDAIVLDADMPTHGLGTFISGEAPDGA